MRHRKITSKILRIINAIITTNIFYKAKISKYDSIVFDKYICRFYISMHNVIDLKIF